MSNSKEIGKYYDDLCEKWGVGYQSADVASQEALDARYAALSEVCNLNNKTVLDVGCGTGGLGEYIQSKYPYVRYFGIDVSRKAVEAGLTERKLSLKYGNVMTYHSSVDVVLAQGIFYLADEKYAKRAIARMWLLAKERVAFTAISSFKKGSADEYRMNAPDMLNWIIHHLTKRVVVRTDHWDGDVCFYLMK